MNDEKKQMVEGNLGLLEGYMYDIEINIRLIRMMIEDLRVELNEEENENTR